MNVSGTYNQFFETFPGISETPEEKRRRQNRDAQRRRRKKETTSSFSDEKSKARRSGSCSVRRTRSGTSNDGTLPSEERLQPGSLMSTCDLHTQMDPSLSGFATPSETHVDDFPPDALTLGNIRPKGVSQPRDEHGEYNLL